jgi:acyl-CoA reductase-like NAD-dependent aldehyde dehydrogenase
MLHIPILRNGRPYRSVDVQRAVHHRTREALVEVSQANPGLIRRDLLHQAEARRALASRPVAELIQLSRLAARHFAEDSLPLGDAAQSPQDYVEQVSATTGLPWVMVRRNMRKIQGVMAEIETVLRGLTRLGDLSVLDTGGGEFDGVAVSFFPRGHSLGVVLPNNSPGVHSLWAPSVALKTPLILKPGSSEPWTPYRMVQAYIKAGVPEEAFGYYPCDHAGAGEILRHCGRGMVFGDVGTTKVWASDPRIEVHGPGWSKIFIGEDCAGEWERHLDVMVDSILQNSGRSCVNASGVWVTCHADAIAEALAARLAKVAPRDASDEQAEIAPFADPEAARRISAIIDSELEGGAVDITAAGRGSRIAEYQGCTYLLPSIVRVPSKDHPLANKEYLFPFASVVEVGQEEVPEAFGPTLVLTAITRDRRVIRRLMGSPHIGRLNLGPISTMKISWDQPHEGNLFDHLYARRAWQTADPVYALQ